MRILHLNEHLDWRGGVETYLLSLIPELESRGHEQAVVYAQGREELLSNTFQVPCLARGDKSAEREGYVALKGILEKYNPDLVHVHQVYNTGAIRACLEQVPVLLHGHDYRYLCPASTFYFKRTQQVCKITCGPRCFVKTLYGHCLTPRPYYAFNYYRRVRWIRHQANEIGRVIAPSEACCQRFIAAGFDPDAVQTLPYFCPIEPLAEPRSIPHTPMMLFIGRIRANKGVSTFIEALGKQHSNVQGVMIGDFTEAARSEVRSLASANGCLERLEMRDWVDRSEIKEVYQQASVFVFPSIWPETLGIVGLEALACGVPVVASDIGGVREWLLPGKTGYLATPKSADELSLGIKKLIEDKQLNEAFGRNGIELIRRRFSNGYHLGRLLDTYKACLKGRA